MVFFWAPPRGRRAAGGVNFGGRTEKVAGSNRGQDALGRPPSYAGFESLLAAVFDKVYYVNCPKAVCIIELYKTPRWDKTLYSCGFVAGFLVWWVGIWN
jgi:hypothetical protein